MSQYAPRGFTLVELIIVIAVIGILASIGIVSWSGVQNTAKQNAAKTTLAKMKLSLSDYYTDKNAYPTNKTPGICDASYPVIPAGDLYTEVCNSTNASYYTYTPAPSGCDNLTTTTKCNTYTLAAKKNLWNGTGSDATLQP